MGIKRVGGGRASLLGGAVLMTGMISGCDGILSRQQDFTISVDSISTTAATGPEDTLVVRFHGTVGSSRCYQLNRVDKHVDPAGIQLRFRGVYRNVHCGQMPVPLEHEERVPPPRESQFTITVIQPEGPPLQEVVVVP